MCPRGHAAAAIVCAWFVHADALQWGGRVRIMLLYALLEQAPVHALATFATSLH